MCSNSYTSKTRIASRARVTCSHDRSTVTRSQKYLFGPGLRADPSQLASSCREELRSREDATSSSEYHPGEVFTPLPSCHISSQGKYL